MRYSSTSALYSTLICLFAVLALCAPAPTHRKGLTHSESTAIFQPLATRHNDPSLLYSTDYDRQWRPAPELQIYLDLAGKDETLATIKRRDYPTFLYDFDSDEEAKQAVGRIKAKFKNALAKIKNFIRKPKIRQGLAGSQETLATIKRREYPASLDDFDNDKVAKPTNPPQEEPLSHAYQSLHEI